MSEDDLPLKQASASLLAMEPEHEIDHIEELTWNLTELPPGARHWHMVIVKKGTIFEDMKGYHVFWYEGRSVAYCKHVHWIDFDEVRKTLDILRRGHERNGERRGNEQSP